jgi:ATP-dependent Clp protease adapter protein ClpS
MSRGARQENSMKFEGTTITTPERPAVSLPDQDEEIADSNVGGGSGFLVIVYDNDKNTWDQVVGILQKATGCTLEEAEIETWEVDNLGKSVVHHAGQEECERAAGIIRTIGIRVEVVED